MPSFSTLTLQTARLDLRPLLPSDDEALLALKSDPVVMRYGSTPPWSDAQVAIDYIQRDLEGMAAGTYVQLAVIRREDAGLIGMCSFHLLDVQCRRAELG